MILSRVLNKIRQQGTSDSAHSLADILKIVHPVFAQHKLRLLYGFIALFCVDFLQLTIPRFIKSGVDSLALGTATNISLVRLGIFIVSAALSVTVLRFAWRYMIIGFSRILERELRNRLYKHVLTMDQPFFEKWTTGDLMAHASNDLSVVQLASGMGMVATADALVMSTAAIGFMLYINVKLTLIALLPMPFLAICTRVLSGRLHHRFNLVQEQFSLITEFARSTIGSIKLIKGYTLEKFQQQQFEQLGNQYVKANLKVAIIQGLLFPIATLVGNVAMLLVLYFGGMLVISKTITLGDFVAFITYLYMLIWPMMAVGWVANLAQRGITSLRRIHLLLEERPVVKDRTSGPSPVGEETSYTINSLSFRYPDATYYALDDINLRIGPGILGITGKTGSGKSTLCKLLLRMYPVKDNVLFFNGRDVNSLPLAELREHIGYVGQEPLLFSDSIANNIAFAYPEATSEEICNAAKAAAVAADIEGLPNGYQSLVGEKGVKLSGGQRQRLTLARALLCDRQFLIIDDALSAIDVETEQAVLNGIRKTLHHKSVIIVSHRINVLRKADRILILDQGAIIAQGNHEELVDNDFYKTMIEKQQADA